MVAEGEHDVSARWVSERLEIGHYTRVTQAFSRVARQPSRKHKNIKRKLAELTVTEQIEKQS